MNPEFQVIHPGETTFIYHGERFLVLREARAMKGFWLCLDHNREERLVSALMICLKIEETRTMMRRLGEALSIAASWERGYEDMCEFMRDHGASAPTRGEYMCTMEDQTNDDHPAT